MAKWPSFSSFFRPENVHKIVPNGSIHFNPDDCCLSQSYKSPFFTIFHRKNGKNMMFVGQMPIFFEPIRAISLATSSAQHPPGAVQALIGGNLKIAKSPSCCWSYFVASHTLPLGFLWDFWGINHGKTMILRNQKLPWIFLIFWDFFWAKLIPYIMEIMSIWCFHIWRSRQSGINHPRLGNTFNYLVTTRIGDPNQLEILQQVDSIRSPAMMSTFDEA